MDALKQIQAELKAPKGQYNQFGKYKYRSCEDILEAVKPLLKKHDAQLTISDELVEVGNRYYIKATATIKDQGSAESVTAYAREAETKKGMDESQITGTASSYARKYALNGLFLIDDTKDADTDDYTARQRGRKPQAPEHAPEPPERETPKVTQSQMQEMRVLIDETGTDTEKMCAYYGVGSIAEMNELQWLGAMSNLKTKKACS